MGADGADELVLASAIEVNDLALSALMKRANVAEIADGAREAPVAEEGGNEEEK